MALSDKSLSIVGRDLVLLGLSFATSVVVARTLGPVGLGTWAMLELILNYARVFGSPRFEIASIYFLGKPERDRGEVLFITNATAVIMGLLAFSLIAWNRDVLEMALFRELSPGWGFVIVTLCYIPILFLTRNYSFFLLSQEDVTSHNLMRIIQEVTKSVLAVTLLLVFDLGLWAMVVALLVAGFVGLVYGVVKVHRTYHLAWSFNRVLLRDMLTFSATQYTTEALGFLTNYLSSLVTALFLSPSAMAFFSMGKGKADYLNQISTAICAVLYPTIANRERNAIDSITVSTDVFRLSLMTLAMVGAIGSVLIYPVTLLLFGKAFAPLALVFWIVVPGTVIHSATSILRQYFIGIGMPEVSLRISVVPLIVQGALCLLLVAQFGVIGVAWAVVVSQVMSGLITIAVYKKLTGTGYRTQLSPTRRDLEILLRKVRELCGKLRAWQANGFRPVQKGTKDPVPVTGS